MKLSIYLLIWFIKLFFPAYWGIPALVIYAQAAHETGKFTSDIFKENANLFGMKLATKRKTTAIGANRGHAMFKNWFASIWDYFLRQKDFNVSGKNKESFINDTVSTGYAEDTSYKQKWQAISKSYSNPLFALIPAVIAGVVILIGHIFYKKITK